jgi:hypothetical protein
MSLAPGAVTCHWVTSLERSGHVGPWRGELQNCRGMMELEEEGVAGGEEVTGEEDEELA